MGQKVLGYRRNHQFKDIGSCDLGWKTSVNPPNILGWDISLSSNSKLDYSLDISISRMIISEFDELLVYFGFISNGRGLSGTQLQGFTLYGEFVNFRKHTPTQTLILSIDRLIIKYESLRSSSIKSNLLEIFPSTPKSLPKSTLSPILKSTLYISKNKDLLKLLISLIIFELESGLNHMSLIRSLEKFIKGLTHKSSGFSFIFTGLLGGSRRKLKYVFKYGKMPLGTISSIVIIEKGTAKTEVGTLGILIIYNYI